MSIRLNRHHSTDGRTLETIGARFKSQAIDKAQWLALRVEKGEFNGN